ELANALQELHRMRNHAARALQQRLDDHGGDLAATLRQQLRQRLNAFDVTRGAWLAHRTAMTISKGDAVCRKTQRTKRLRKSRVGADRHGPYGIAVISMFKGHNFLLVALPSVLPVLDRHLQRNLDRSRSVIGEEDVV